MEKEKANWDAHHITVFCEICKDEVEKGNRPKGCLNRRGYKHLEEKFFDRTGKRCSQNQFKNKWDMLKRQYVQFMLLKNAATGLGWDDVKKTIVADDDWWKVHLKKNPKHAKYKKKGLSNLIEMHVMFNNAHVIGATSSIPGEISDSIDDDILDVEMESEEDEKAAKEVRVSPKDGKVAKEGKVSPKDGKSTKEGKVAKNVKRKAKFIDESAKEVKNPFLREYKATLGNINAEIAATRAPTSVVPTMKKVLTSMKECGAEEGTPLYFTATDLVLQSNYKELFMLIETKEVRLDWLKRKHDQMNK